jgi:hypothetical protein
MATTVDDCSDCLHATGWSIGETCFRTEAGPVWQADGTNGENQLLAQPTPAPITSALTAMALFCSNVTATYA